MAELGGRTSFAYGESRAYSLHYSSTTTTKSSTQKMKSCGRGSKVSLPAGSSPRLGLGISLQKLLQTTNKLLSSIMLSEYGHEY